MLARLFWQRDW